MRMEYSAYGTVSLPNMIPGLPFALISPDHKTELASRQAVQSPAQSEQYCL